MYNYCNRNKTPNDVEAGGKTQHVEGSQLGDVYPHWTAHSVNVWTTEDTFIQYLDHIAQNFNNEPVHIILDVYAAHQTESVKQFAEGLNITLYFIPPGCTDLVQPLDVKVYLELSRQLQSFISDKDIKALQVQK